MKRLLSTVLVVLLCGAAWAADKDVYIIDYTGLMQAGKEQILGREKTNEVSIFASPGEYEPFAFALNPKEQTPDVMIKGGALTGPAGVIPVANVVVQSAEGGHGDNKRLYSLSKPWHMAGWTKEFFWVTVKVPGDAKPGIYKGVVTVTSEGRPFAKVNVSLDVLPIRLEEPPFCLGFHYAWPGSVEALRANLKDMREHGMTNVGPLYGWHMPITDDDTSQLNTFMKEYLTAGYTKPMMFAAPMNLTLSGLTGYGPVDSKRFQQKYIEVMRKLHAEMKKHDVPVIFSIGDEFTNKGLPGVEYGEKLAKLTHEELPEICTTSDADGAAEVLRMAPYMNFATFNNGWDGPDRHNRGKTCVNDKFIAEVKAAGAIPYFVNTGRGRFPFGFFFWKMSKYGVFGKVEWFYNLQGSGGGKGSMVKLDGTNITRTINYEKSREGVDDLKYLCLLEKLIRQAEKTGKGRAPAAEAKAFLKKLEDSIIPNWSAYQRGGEKWPQDGAHPVDNEKAGTIGSFNTLRRAIADRIIKVQDAMK